MKEQIEIAFMDFQENLMTLHTKGIINLEYNFTSPLEDISILNELPEAFRALYFSDGYEILWKTDNSISGYWNLIASNDRKSVKDQIIENSVTETELLKKFIPIFYESPETVIGYTRDGNPPLVWKYSTNNLQLNLLEGITPEEYVYLVMDAFCIENFSDMIINYNNESANDKNVISFILKHNQNVNETRLKKYLT